MSVLEGFATKVAERVAGPEPSAAETTASGIGVPDWTALIEMIMELVMSLLGTCTANDTKVVAAAKKPNILQRVRFKSQVYRQLRQSTTTRWRNESAAICKGLLEQAEDSTEAELLDVVFETRNADWLAI